MTHALIPTSSAINPLTGLAVIILTLALHLALFLNYPTSQTPPQEVVSTAIEIGLVTIAKPLTLVSTTTAVKPTPITKQSTPAKPPVKKKPKPISSKSATPKAAIPKPITSKPITRPQMIESTQIEASPAEENTASLEKENTTTPITAASTSPTPASLGSINPDIKASYEASLVAWLQRYKRYPTIAKRKGQEDIVELEITIDTAGNVLSQKLITASSYKSLNKATMKMVNRASPLPAVPEEIQNNKTRFTFIIPLVFKLN
jgi:protein TonB